MILFLYYLLLRSELFPFPPRCEVPADLLLDAGAERSTRGEDCHATVVLED